jgi:uncharacterized damage-inducible protein DinB
MSPAKKRAARGRAPKRAAPKRAATKRAATKRAATKRAETKRTAAKRAPTKRAATKRTATRRTATKRTATKRTATKRAATKRTATKRPGKAPASGLRLVRAPAPRAKRGPAPAAAPPPAFPQRAEASPKQLVLFELVRAWARVLAATQGLAAATAGRPAGGVKWSIRETVLHLHAWDLEWERSLEPAFRGVRPGWLDDGPAELARFNRALLEPLRLLSWDEAVRRLHAGRARLLEAIESLPEEPAVLWTQNHPLGELLAALHEHDQHHAEAIRRARAEAPPQPRTP